MADREYALRRQTGSHEPVGLPRWVGEGGPIEAERREVAPWRIAGDQRRQRASEPGDELVAVPGPERDVDVRVVGQRIDDEVAIGRQRVEARCRRQRLAETSAERLGGKGVG